MLDWQTEEDHDWNDPPTPSQTAVSPWPRRLMWLVIGLLLSGGFWYAASLVQERIEVATDETEAELRQAHALLYQTAQNRDTELFSQLISGRDGVWANAQEALLQDGRLLDRPSWGAYHHPPEEADTITTITLSPDLLAAEVTAVEPYQFWSVADQSIKTTYLQQTAVYRLGPDRWLYAPPEPDFWGETAEISGDFLHLTFPERDREVVEQLFPNLNALLANTCRLPGLACDTIHAQFSTNPTTLGKNLRLAFLNPDGPIVLPTPTLLGLPQDAAGYEFLWQAYGRYLSSHTITRQTGYDCCRYAIYYQILLHYQLSQLNLHDWPLSQPLAAKQAVYRIPPDELIFNEALFPTGVHTSLTDLDILATAIEADTNPIATSFQQIPADLQVAYILVDHLVADQTVVAADWQRQLNQHEHLLGLYNAVSQTAVESEEHLRLQLADHITRYHPDVALPPDSLTVTCSPTNPAPFLSYNPATRTWQERPLPPLANPDWSQPAFRQIHPTPYANVYLLETADTLYLASDGLLRPIQLSGSFPPQNYTLYITAAPDGQLLNLTWEQLQRNQRFTVHYQLDPTACDDESCPTTTAPGEISWSPNGRYTLITINEWQAIDPGPGLYLGDEQGNVVTYLADHYDRLRPVWLDDNHIAVPSLTNGNTVQYAIYPLADPTTPLLTITPDILHQAATSEQADPFRPIQPIELWSNPANPQQLLIHAAQPWIQGQVGAGVAYEHHYLVWAELTADFTQIERVVRLHQSAEWPLAAAFSPAGEQAILYETAHTYYESPTLIQPPASLAEQAFTLHPLAETMSPIPPTWSPDGDWLAAAYPFGLLLTDTHTMSQFHLAPYDLSNCTDIQWAN